MSKDNTLGAPTEGLGQTVTFTTNGSGGIPQLQTTQLQGLRAEQRGGEARLTAAPVQIPDAMAGAGVLNAIAKIGGGIFNEAIERERKDAYMTGVRRVASGEAVKEIVDEQPWVSKLFGPTPAVEGARAYAGSTLAQKAAMEAEQELKQLQQVSPQEYQSYITQKLNSLKSGDDSTDFIALQAFTQEIPGLVKAHSKAHLVWQQSNLAAQASSNQEVAASRYASIAARYDSTVQADKLLNGDDAEAFMDDNDLLESKVKFVQAFALPPGIPKETHDKLTAKTIGAVLARGDLSSYYVLEDAGVVRDLGPDHEKRLREQADRVESRKRAELPASFSAEYGAIKALPMILGSEGPEKAAENLAHLQERVTALNDHYKRATGAREPLIQGASFGEIQASFREYVHREQIRLADAAARLADKRLTEAQKAAEKQTVLYTTIGLLKNGEDTGAATAQQVEAAFAALRNEPESLAQARKAQFARGVTDKVGQGDIRREAIMAIDAKDFNAFHAAYIKHYRPLLKEGDDAEAVALHYFGIGKHDAGEKFSTYHRLVGDSNDATIQAAAFAQVYVDRKPLDTGKNSLDQRGLKAIKDVMDTGVLGFFRDTAPVAGMNADTVSQTRYVNPTLHDDLWKMVKPLVESSTLPLESAVPAAIRRLEAEGLEYSSGFFWTVPKGTPTVRQRVNELGTGSDLKNYVTPDQFDDALEKSVAERAKATGLAADSVNVVHWAQGKENGLAILGVDANNQTRIVTLTAKQIYDDEIARRKADWDGKALKGTSWYHQEEAGPKHPGIYNRDPEAWRKYREAQAAAKAAKP